MPEKKFELTNLETGKKTTVDVKSGTLGPDVLDIGRISKEHGVFTFDPGFMVTASCESKITFIDGEAGVLLHRGIPIEQLAEKSNFLEVAYLLINGELPTSEQLAEFTHAIQYHTMINESLLRFFNGFQYNAHPMAMLSGVVASMAAFYHDSMDIHNPRHREIFAHRIIAKIPTIAAAAYKHSLGQPFIYPRNDLDYCSNLLHMFFAVPCEQYNVDPVTAQALDLLFILHADHEQNASTSTVRLAGSTGANPYAAISAGISALWGRERAEVPREGEGQERQLPLDGLRPSRLQELRSARHDHSRHVPQGAREAGQVGQPIVRARAQARRDRAQGRVLRRAQALSERRFLLGHHLQRDRNSAVDVHCDVRDRSHRRLGCALAGDDLRPDDEDQPPAPALHGSGEARLRRNLATRLNVWRERRA
jgi:hypothetical protein